MLMPKKIKFKKIHRKYVKKFTPKMHLISFGKYAIISMVHGYISSKQIEASRIVLNKYIKKTGKLWIRIFPHHPLTKKPLEIRMGKGKGNIDKWVSNIQKGQILYEFDGVDIQNLYKIVKLAQSKLPLKIKLLL